MGLSGRRASKLVWPLSNLQSPFVHLVLGTLVTMVKYTPMAEVFDDGSYLDHYEVLVVENDRPLQLSIVAGPGDKLLGTNLVFEEVEL